MAQITIGQDGTLNELDITQDESGLLRIGQAFTTGPDNVMMRYDEIKIAKSTLPYLVNALRGFVPKVDQRSRRTWKCSDCGREGFVTDKDDDLTKMHTRAVRQHNKMFAGKACVPLHSFLNITVK